MMLLDLKKFLLPQGYKHEIFILIFLPKSFILGILITKDEDKKVISAHRCEQVHLHFLPIPESRLEL